MKQSFHYIEHTVSVSSFLFCWIGSILVILSVPFWGQMSRQPLNAQSDGTAFETTLCALSEAAQVLWSTQRERRHERRITSTQEAEKPLLVIKLFLSLYCETFSAPAETWLLFLALLLPFCTFLSSFFNPLFLKSLKNEFGKHVSVRGSDFGKAAWLH